MGHMPRKTHIMTHAQELVTLRTGQDLGALLVQRYVAEARSQATIALELGVTRLTVCRWLLEYGITRDDRERVPA